MRPDDLVECNVTQAPGKPAWTAIRQLLSLNFFMADMQAGIGPFLSQRAQEHGLIIRNLGDSIGVCPPLVITEGEVDELVKRLNQAFADTLAHVRGSKAAA